MTRLRRKTGCWSRFVLQTYLPTHRIEIKCMANEDLDIAEPPTPRYEDFSPTPYIFANSILENGLCMAPRPQQLHHQQNPAPLVATKGIE